MPRDENPRWVAVLTVAVPVVPAVLLVWYYQPQLARAGRAETPAAVARTPN